MNCSNCGNPLNGNERFCEKCGNPIQVNQNMSFGGVNPSNPVNSFGANMNQNTAENSVLQNMQPNFAQPAVASNDQFSTLNNQSNSFGGNVSNTNMNNDVNSNQGVMNGSTYNQQPQVGQSQTNMYGQSMNTNQMGYGQSMNNQMSQTGMYGQPMNSPTTQPQYGQMPGMNQQPEKKNVGLIIVLVILIIAVLGAGGFAIYHFTQSDDTEEKEDKNDKEDKDEDDDQGTVEVELGGKTLKIPEEYSVEDYKNGILISSSKWKIYMEVLDGRFSSLNIETINANLTNSNHNIYSYDEKNIGGNVYFVFDLTYSGRYRKYMYGSFTSNKVVAVEIISNSSTDKPSSSTEEIVNEIVSSAKN